jgi:hypothetical protein
MEQIPLAELGKYGLAGTVVSIAIWVAWSYKGDLAGCWKERLTDWKAMQEVIGSIQSTLVSVTSVMESRTRAQEDAARALAVLTAEIQRLRDEVLRIREDRRG